MKKINKKEKGFTLIELLVVIAIIGILASMTFVNLQASVLDANVNRAKQELSSLAKAMTNAKIAENKVLKDITGNNNSSQVCVDSGFSSSQCVSSWNNVLTTVSNADDTFGNTDIITITADPWGSPYALVEREGVDSNNPCVKDYIYSAGPDRSFGGGDDITVNGVTQLAFTLAECS